MKQNARKNQKRNRLKKGSRLRGKSSSYVAATSSPPRLHHSNFSAGSSLWVRRTLMTISLQMPKSAMTTKIEKKTPNMLAGRFLWRPQDNLFAHSVTIVHCPKGQVIFFTGCCPLDMAR